MTSRRRMHISLSWRVVLACSLLACTWLLGWTQQRHPKLFDAFDNPKVEKKRVYSGDPETAESYYKKMGSDLKFPDGKVPGNLDSLLHYFGYAPLTAKQIESADPAVLLDPQKLLKLVFDSKEPTHGFNTHPLKHGEILTTRFFAPKTSDVSGRSNNLSWRRLVRLKARSGSDAKKRGLDAIYWLSNSYVKLGTHPFSGHAQNNQVILTTHPDSGLDPLYWLVFDSLEKGKNGNRILYTATSWDAADPAIWKETKGGKKYYLPDSCIECHGRDKKSGMLSYLDTDHWLDRVQKGDDFEELGKSKWPVLFDAGKKPGLPTYKQAFAVIRQLNEEICEQNQRISPRSHITRAAENWLRLHANDKFGHMHAPLLQRGMPGRTDPSVRWEEHHANDRKLLPLLNRYCYRCHSTLMFHVYDKQTFLNEAGLARDFVADGYMPQDRDLNALPHAKKELMESLRTLIKNTGH